MNRLMVVLLIFITIFLFTLAFLLGGVAFVPAIIACAVLALLIAVIGILTRINRTVALLILAVLSTALSLWSAIVLGIKAVGDRGAIFATLGWLIALPLATYMIRTKLVVIEEGTIAIIERSFIGGSQVLHHWDRVYPLIPFLEKVKAILPVYELSYRINVQKIRMHCPWDIIVYYKVSDPIRVVYYIPNRERIIREVIEERPDKGETICAVSNWERIIEKAIEPEIITAVRNVLSAMPSPAEAYEGHFDLCGEIRMALNITTQIWGIEVTRVELDLKAENVVPRDATIYLDVPLEAIPALSSDLGSVRLEDAFLRLTGLRQVELSLIHI